MKKNIKYKVGAKSSDEIQDIIRDLVSRPNEEEWFEFKENWYLPDGIGEYISALSNAATLKGQSFAYMIWGVHNESHEFTGTDFNFKKNVKNEPLEHYLTRNLNPHLNFDFQEKTMDDKRIVVLVIPAAHTVPTAFKNVRYLRIGSSKVNLEKYPEHEAALFRVLNFGIPTIDNTVSEYQELTFDQLFLYYGIKGITLNKRTFKKNLGLLTKDGKYNLLARLLSDEPHVPIRFSLFKGKTKTSTLYAVREFGNMCLLMAFDRVLDYGEVLNVPQADERNRKVERKEVMLFDRAAYREAIINAFVHNLWVSGHEPMFTAFEDRIEILSRGTLAAGLTLDGFFAGESVPVNQRLSDIFMQLHISERSGRGVPKIVEVYGKNAYDFRQNSIVVTIPFNKLELDSQQPVTGAEIPPVTGAEIPPVTGAKIPSVSGAEIPSVSGAEIPSVSGAEIPSVSEAKNPPVSGAENPPVSDTEISP
ncbi:MAG: putative DNA binding domain-containing protein, partial [Victivallales bacterium]|nr:putative DNA binding domain-containing protein [Victivallales bacterium]